MKYIEIINCKKLGDIFNVGSKLVTNDNKVNDNEVLKKFYEEYKDKLFSYKSEELRKISNEKNIKVIHKIISKDYKEFIIAPYSYRYFDYMDTNNNIYMTSINEILQDYKDPTLKLSDMNNIAVPNEMDIDFLVIELVDKLGIDNSKIFKIIDNKKEYVYEEV